MTDAAAPPILFPDTRNALAEERHDCTKLAVKARTEAQRSRIAAWADRLTVRIAERAAQ